MTLAIRTTWFILLGFSIYLFADVVYQGGHIISKLGNFHGAIFVVSAPAIWPLVTLFRYFILGKGKDEYGVGIVLMSVLYPLHFVVGFMIGTGYFALEFLFTVAVYRLYFLSKQKPKSA